MNQRDSGTVTLESRKGLLLVWTDVGSRRRYRGRQANVGPALRQRQNGGSHDHSANGQKTDVGPTLFFRPDYDIGKLTSGRHLTNVGKDEIHDKSANNQKIDVGLTLLFRPDYDIAKIMSGRHLANVGKDYIHDKSANCQKTDVGPMLFFGPEL